MTKKGYACLTLLMSVWLFLLLIPAAAAENDPTLLGFYVTPGTGKTVYKEGELFDPSGYTGNLTYSDGSIVAVPGEMLTYSPKTPLSASDKSIIFNCPGSTVTYGCPIAVTAARGITIVSMPEKTSYYAYETFDPRGLAVALQYEDGDIAVIDNSMCSFTVGSSGVVDETALKVTVTCNSGSKQYTTDFPISVTKIVSLRVTSQPDIVCYEGDCYPPDAAPTVEATYEDGQTREITNFDIPDAAVPLKPDSDGMAVIHVVCGNVSAEFSVEVKSVAGYEVTLGSAKDDYHLGEAFDPTGITVYANYSDGTVRDITSEVIFDAPEQLAADSVIRILWNDTEIPFEGIGIRTAVLRVTSQPTKKEYMAGEKFDPAGLTVFATYDDGETIRLTDAEYEILGGDSLTEKDTFVTISWHGATAEIPVKVVSENAIIEIEVAATPSSVKFVAGQSLDFTGISVIARRQKGDMVISDPLTFDDLVFDPPMGTPLTPDIRQVIISYGDYSVVQPIEVEDKTAVNLVVLSRPDKTVYHEGERFSPLGLEVSVVYNDGTTVPVTGFSIGDDDAFVLKSNSTQTVTISIYYGDMKCTTDVTVQPLELKSLTVLAQPTKTVYKAGDSFSSAGMKIMLNYADTSVDPVVLSDGDYGVAPAGPLTIGDTAVYVTFRGLSAKVAIQVTQNGEAPVTTEVTTEADTVITEAPITQAPVTGSPIVTADPGIITEPADPTPVTGEQTRSPENTDNIDDEDEKKGPSTMMILWIVILSVIVIALVILIIYYKRNFT